MLLLPLIVEEIQIVSTIEKQTLISSTAKNVAAGIPLGLSLDDSNGHKEAVEFIAKLTRSGLAYASTAVFHDRIADSLVTTATADGEVPVPSGNYNVDGGTDAGPASYWKLRVLELLKEGGISWLSMFNHCWFGNSTLTQNLLRVISQPAVHKYADQKFRVPQL